MTTGKRQRRLHLAAWEEFDFYLGISPWLIGFLFFTGGPILASLGISFTEWKLLTPPQWVGLDNYVRLFSRDPLFWVTLGNTAYYTLFSVPLSVLVALLMAVLVNQDVPGVNFVRTIFYLPSVTAGVAGGLLWLWIFNPEFGLLNYGLSLLGIQGPGWLVSQQWAKPALILMSLWSVGGGMVIFLAGLQGLPRHLYDAARIDGATTWQEFRHLTVPLLTPVIFFMIVVSTISSFQTFTNVYVMTRGGPGTATLLYSLYLYENAFEFLKMGYASALAWVLFVVILLLTIAQFGLSRRWVYYEGDLRQVR